MDEQAEKLILHDTVTYEDFAKVAEHDLGLQKIETHLARENPRMDLEVWRTEDQATTVNFINDENRRCRYLWITGAKLRKFFSRLYDLLPSDDGEDLIESLRGATNPEKVFFTILKIGLVYSDFDPQAFKVYDHYIKHSEEYLRRATLDAICRSGLWPECRSLLEQVVQTDSEEPLRQLAQIMLEAQQAVVKIETEAERVEVMQSFFRRMSDVYPAFAQSDNT
jgi:hypothetical protein